MKEKIELQVADLIDPVFKKGLPQNMVSLIADMKQFLRDNPEESYCIPAFIGGENLAILVLRVKKRKKEMFISLINPTVLSNKGIVASEERQYGIEGIYLLQRSPQILYAGIAAGDLKAVQAEILGRTALTIQQACEALKGVSINVLGIRIDDFEEYQEGTAEDKSKIFEALIDELKVRREKLKSEETEQYVKATSFVAEKLERSMAIERAVSNKTTNRGNKAK